MRNRFADGRAVLCMRWSWVLASFLESPRNSSPTVTSDRRAISLDPGIYSPDKDPNSGLWAARTALGFGHMGASSTEG